MQFRELSDGDLFSRLQNLCVESRRIDVRVIELLIEVEERRLDLRWACASLFDFCVTRLGLSSSSAQRRITIARMARKFPCLLGHLESGKVHMCALAELRDHLTAENVEQMVDAIAKKSRREVEDLVKSWAPRADVPGTIRKLPQVDAVAPSVQPSLLTEAGTAPGAPSEVPAEARYRLQMTASAQLNDKIIRARDLMSHSNPTGDLAVLVERAMDALLEKLERPVTRKKTSRPESERRPSKPGYVPAAVRREVFARDGRQCTFVGEQGGRCPSRRFLQIDHVKSWALGGSDKAENLRVLCRAHNRLHAEDDFTREHVERKIHIRRRKCSRPLPAPQVQTPTLPPTPQPDNEAAFELVKRGLVNLGFRATDAARALRVVLGHHPEAADPPAILRAALSVLTG